MSRAARRSRSLSPERFHRSGERVQICRELRASREASLAPCFVDDHSNRVRQIQAAVVRPHRQAQGVFRWQRIEECLRQSARFRAEHDRVVAAQLCICIQRAAARGQREQAIRSDFRNEGVEIVVHVDRGELVIVEAGAAQLRIVELEAEGGSDAGARRNSRTGGSHCPCWVESRAGKGRHAACRDYFALPAPATSTRNVEHQQRARSISQLRIANCGNACVGPSVTGSPTVTRALPWTCA